MKSADLVLHSFKRGFSFFEKVSCVQCTFGVNTVDAISIEKLHRYRKVKPEASSIMRALSGARCTDARLYTL